jgi:cytidine deaminase
MELAEATIQRLLSKAREAQQNAWAPYSNFHVGAAVLSEDGRVFLGCNVENASYGLSVCAERNAIGATVVAGARPVAIAVVAPLLGCPPCGACRQVLAEFGLEVAVILTSGSAPGYVVTTSGALLPGAFTEESLRT